MKMTHIKHTFGASLSERQKQWLWFVGLWIGGFLAVFLLASVIRMVMGL